MVDPIVNSEGDKSKSFVTSLVKKDDKGSRRPILDILGTNRGLLGRRVENDFSFLYRRRARVLTEMG